VNPFETAKLLQLYGPWGVCVILLGIIWVLWRALENERKKRDADARGFHIAQIQNVKDAADREQRFSDVVRMFAPRG
jgi:hypothetical protein